MASLGNTVGKVDAFFFYSFIYFLPQMCLFLYCFTWRFNNFLCSKSEPSNSLWSPSVFSLFPFNAKNAGILESKYKCTVKHISCSLSWQWCVSLFLFRIMDRQIVLRTLSQCLWNPREKAPLLRWGWCSNWHGWPTMFAQSQPVVLHWQVIEGYYNKVNDPTSTGGSFFAVCRGKVII